MAHRPDQQDAFPTGLTRLTDSQFSVPAHWPTPHRFFSPVTGGYQDPLLIAESIRQTTMLIAHSEFGVPLDASFVMWQLHYASEAQCLVLGEDPWDLTMEVTCSRIQYRARRLGSMDVDFLFHRRGTLFATGGGRISVTSAAIYQRLRGHRSAMLDARIPLLPAVAPHAVGRTSERDVVLAPAPAPDTWELRVDTRHPTLYSHPNDHVPGILLMEAARQAAQAFSPGRTFLPASMEADFLQYVELDRPCRIEALPVPADETSPAGVLIRAVQGDEPAFTCTLRTPDPHPTGPSDARSRRS
ncbi:ScbA/BarX family gamma-butyrolactone biosynthesis protein [Streptomyces sp. NPDC058221]|uniref:ScbA/BarX family gamma-butyrolactone biosynthesis protein n=1 Tax=Streptomyces sp. NPDC058221 TaxID=3346388 RepID=UPI0036EBCECD